jgi:DNA polymerase
VIWVDFETRSACDLKSAGAYNYAQSLSTEVLCMAYAYDDGDVQM